MKRTGLIFFVSFGVLGFNASEVHATTPVRATQIAGGYYHVCALTHGGGVKCWGSNSNGQLGNTGGSSSVPVDVVGLTSGVVAIAAGNTESCAVMAAGGVKCWGLGSKAQTNTPKDVAGLPNSAVESIDVGFDHACVVTSAGQVWCWGSNAEGQLGDGTASPSGGVAMIGLSDRPVVINAAFQKTCVTSEAGVAQCVGWNNWGQLGDSTNTNRSVAVDVFDTTPYGQIAGKFQHTCGIIIGGGVKCWGFGQEGELGEGTGIHVAENYPVDVFGLSSGVDGITANYNHTCAMMQTGGVKCWGSNVNGQLGVDRTTITGSTQPLDVIGLASNAVAITSAAQLTCVILDFGGIQCWGVNNDGQVGNGQSGATLRTSTPTNVVGFVTADDIFASGFEEGE